MPVTQWMPSHSDFSSQSYFSCEAFAIDRQQPNVIYMALGKTYVRVL